MSVVAGAKSTALRSSSFQQRRIIVVVVAPLVPACCSKAPTTIWIVLELGAPAAGIGRGEAGPRCSNQL